MQPPFLLHLRSHFSRIHSANPIIFRVVLLGDLVSFNFRAGKVRENQTGVKINGNKVSMVRPRLPRKYKGFFVTLLLYMIVCRIKALIFAERPKYPRCHSQDHTQVVYLFWNLCMIHGATTSWRNQSVALLRRVKFTCLVSWRESLRDLQMFDNFR